jgi:hypothetical protein
MLRWFLRNLGIVLGLILPGFLVLALVQLLIGCLPEKCWPLSDYLEAGLFYFLSLLIPVASATSLYLLALYLLLFARPVDVSPRLARGVAILLTPIMILVLPLVRVSYHNVAHFVVPAILSAAIFGLIVTLPRRERG